MKKKILLEEGSKLIFPQKIKSWEILVEHSKTPEQQELLFEVYKIIKSNASISETYEEYKNYPIKKFDKILILLNDYSEKGSEMIRYHFKRK